MLYAMWPRSNGQPQPPPETRSLSFDWLDSCVPWDCFRNFRRRIWPCGARGNESERCCGLFSVCCRRNARTSVDSVESPPQANNIGLSCICPLQQRNGNSSTTDINIAADISTPQQRHGQFCFGRMTRPYEVGRKRSESFNGRYSKLTQRSDSSQRCLNPLVFQTDRERDIDRIRLLSSNTTNVLRNQSNADSSDSVVFFQGCCGYATFSSDCCTGHPYLSRCQSLSDSLISSKRDYDIVFFRGKCGYASFDPNCCRLLQTMHYNMRVNSPESLPMSPVPEPTVICSEKRTVNELVRKCPDHPDMSTSSDNSEEPAAVPVFKSQFSSQSHPEILILSCGEQLSSSRRSAKKAKSIKRPKTGLSGTQTTLAPKRQSFSNPRSLILDKLKRADLISGKSKKVVIRDEVKLKVIGDTVTGQNDVISSSLREHGVTDDSDSGQTSKELMALSSASVSETDVHNMAAEISYKAINAAIVECQNSENTKSYHTTEPSGSELVYLHLTVTPTFECDSSDITHSHDVTVTNNTVNIRSEAVTENSDSTPTEIFTENIREGVTPGETVTENADNTLNEAVTDNVNNTLKEAVTDNVNNTLNEAVTDNVNNTLNEAVRENVNNTLKEADTENADNIRSETITENADNKPSVAVTKNADNITSVAVPENVDDITSAAVTENAVIISSKSVTEYTDHISSDVTVTDHKRRIKDERPGTVSEMDAKGADNQDMTDKTKTITKETLDISSAKDRVSDDRSRRQISLTSHTTQVENIGLLRTGSRNHCQLSTQESGSFELLSHPDLCFLSESGQYVKGFMSEYISVPSEETGILLHSECPLDDLVDNRVSSGKIETSKNLSPDDCIKFIGENNEKGFSHTTETTVKTVTAPGSIVEDTDTNALNDIGEADDLSTNQKSKVVMSITQNLNRDFTKSISHLTDDSETPGSGKTLHFAPSDHTFIPNQPSSGTTKQTSISKAADFNVLSSANKNSSSQTFITTSSEMTRDTASNPPDNDNQAVKSDQTDCYDPHVAIFEAENFVKTASDLSCQIQAAQVQPSTLSRHDLTQTACYMCDKPVKKENCSNRKTSEWCKLEEKHDSHDNHIKDLCSNDNTSKHVKSTSTGEEFKHAATHISEPNVTITTNSLEKEISAREVNGPLDWISEFEANTTQNDEMSVNSLEKSIGYESKSPTLAQEGREKSLSLIQTTIDNPPLFMTDSISNPHTSQSNGDQVCMGYTSPTQTSSINTQQASHFSAVSHEGNILNEADDTSQGTVSSSDIDISKETWLPGSPTLHLCSVGDPGNQFTRRESHNQQRINTSREGERNSGSRPQLGKSISQIPLQDLVSSGRGLASDSATSGLTGSICHSDRKQRQRIKDETDGSGVTTSEQEDSDSKSSGVEVDCDTNRSLSSSDQSDRKTGQIKTAETVDDTIKSSATDGEGVGDNSTYDTDENVSFSETSLQPGCSSGGLNDANGLKKIEDNVASVLTNEQGGSIRDIPDNVNILTIERIDFSHEAELFAKQLLFESDKGEFQGGDSQGRPPILDVYMLSIENPSARSPSGNAFLPYGSITLEQDNSFPNTPADDVVPSQKEVYVEGLDSVPPLDCRKITHTDECLSKDVFGGTASAESSVLRPCRQTFESSVSFEIAEGIVKGEDKGDNRDSSCVSDYIREYNELCKSSLENERRILRSVLENVRGCYSPSSLGDQTLPALHGFPSRPRQNVRTHTEQYLDSSYVNNHRPNSDRVANKRSWNRDQFSNSTIDSNAYQRGKTNKYQTDEAGYPLFRAITEETDEQLREDDLGWFDPKLTPQTYQERDPKKNLKRQKCVDKTDYISLKRAEGQKTNLVSRKKDHLNSKSNSPDFSVERSRLDIPEGPKSASQGSPFLKKSHTKPRTPQKKSDKYQDQGSNRNKAKTLKRQTSRRVGITTSSSRSSQTAESTSDVTVKRDSGDIVVIQKRRNGRGGIVKEEKLLKTKRKVTAQAGDRKRYRTCVVSGICDDTVKSNSQEGITTEHSKEGPEASHRSKQDPDDSDVKKTVDKAGDTNRGGNFNCSGARPKALLKRITKMSGRRDPTDVQRRDKRNRSVKDSNRYENVTDRQNPERMSQLSPEIDGKARSGSRSSPEEGPDDQTFDSSRYEEVLDDSENEDDYGRSRTLSSARQSGAVEELKTDTDKSFGSSSADTYRKETTASDGEYMTMLAEGELSFMKDLKGWREAYNINADEIEREALKLLAGDLTNLYADLPDSDKAEVTKEIENMDSMTNDDLMNSLRG